MSIFRSLFKDTALYGLSSIVGRLLNYLLFPFYTKVFVDTGEYGVVSTLYSYSGVLLVLLTYGMETGFFRFANKRDNPLTVYSTSLISLAATSLMFIVIVTAFINPISSALMQNHHRACVWMLGVTVAIDAFTAIPFAYLRFKKKAKHFAAIKLINIVISIGLNVFFLYVCPRVGVLSANPLYQAFDGIEWVFVANLIASSMMLLLLLPQLRGLKWRFDGLLLRRMLEFSFPMLITGVAGTFAHNMGQIIIPHIWQPGWQYTAEQMVGLYSAGIKVAVILTMFSQAFRFAFEPRMFESVKGTDINERNRSLCDAVKSFVIVSLLIYMLVTFAIPFFKTVTIFGHTKHLIGKTYWPGLQVVPIVMGAEICFGVFSNMSMWCKLTDRTIWSSVFSIIAFVMMAALNIKLVAYFGASNSGANAYVGSAWASLISYAFIMVACWAVGQHYFPLKYQVGRMLLYAAVAVGLTLLAERYTAGAEEPQDITWFGWVLKCLCVLVFISVVIIKEKIKLPIKR